MKNLIKKPVFIISAVVVLGVIGYLVFGGTESPAYETIIVQRN